jgi:hypothetical protein
MSVPFVFLGFETEIVTPWQFNSVRYFNEIADMAKRFVQKMD